MGKGIFITGTDTGIGKTFVAARLARSLVSRGVDVGVMKPVETGCRSRQGLLVPNDARELMRAANVTDHIDLINPFRYRASLAPAVAAEKEGRRVSVSRILAAYRALSKRHRFVIVEGAGGIMVPLDRNATFLDLAEQLHVPVLIIARPNLGTINHTMLTVMAIRSRGLPISGIVLNDALGLRSGLAERTNPSVIERLTGIPVLASIRYGAENLPEAVLRSTAA